MRALTSANETTGRTDWNAVNWKQTNRVVRNLRQRIFKAAQAGDAKKVRQLQKLMLRSRSNTLLSVRRVTQVNAGKNTSGIDKVVIKTPKARGALVDDLQSFQPWKAKPARRVYIPKANGTQRPLGIPTVADRAMQARVKNALEPEWEAKFEGCSFGFRPGRSPHDAITAVYSLSHAGTSKRWVVDADIQGAFDNISHDFLQTAIGSFPARELVRQWLKAGYVEAGVFHGSTAGTPQGGVISPLLANIALHGLEHALGVKRDGRGWVKRSKRALVRYADDFVVFCDSQEDAQKAVIDLQTWLAKRGLELSTSKTRIAHLTEGFDFLGFNVRLYKERNNEKHKLLIKPSQDSVNALRAKLRSEWMSLRGANAAAVVARLNPIIRGWANYFKVGVASKAFRDLDNFMFQRCVRWAKWTHPHKPWYFLKEKYWGPLHRHRKANWVFGDKLSGAYLIKFGWTPIERHTKVKGRASKDDPTLRDYWLAREAKATKLNRNKRKLASLQKNLCPVCGDSLFNGETLHEHHVILDKSSVERTSPHHRKLVHLFCHQQIHLAGPKNAPAAARKLLP